MRTSTWAVLAVGIGLMDTRVEAQQAGAAMVRGKVTDNVEGPKPEDAIRLALRRKQRMFEHCFEMELRKQAPFSGNLLVELSVSVEGLVTRAVVTEGNQRESAVGACIAAQMRTIKLPALAYEADLIIPIRLEAKPPRPLSSI